MKQKLLNLFRLRAFALIAILCAGVSAAWGAEFTYSFSSGGTFDGGDNPTATWTTDYFTILQEKNTSTSPVANYLTAPRWYKNHNVTITPVANCTITNIVINCSKDYTGQDITASTGNVSKDGNNSTWTGSITNETPLVLTMGAQCRPTSLVVTYEFAGTIPPSISVVVDAVELEYNDKEGEIAYTIENPVSGTSLSATTEADWISNINVTSDKVTFMTTQNDGDVARTADITLSYAGATSKVVSVTQKYNVPDFAKLPFNWEGGASSDLLRLAGVTANGLGSDYAANNAPYIVKFDTTDDYIQIKTNGQPGKVTIGVKMIGGGNTSTITVQGSADGETFTNVQALAISGNQNNELTLGTDKPFDADVRYVRLLFTKGSNVGVGPISIELPSNDPQISAENQNIDYNKTSGIISCEIINPVEGGVITATTDASWLTFGETGVAYTTTVNEAVEARTANVTITYTYNSNQTITKAVTVTQAGDPNAPGSQNNPYTVAQARAAIDAGEGVTDVYVTGVISQIDSYSSQYNSITYWISEDGTTTNQLEVYSGKGLNNAIFSSKDDIVVGATVVVYGTLKKYNDTYEFDKNNYLTSYTAPAVDVEAPTFNPAAGTYAEAQTVTIACATDGATIYYTTDGTDPTNESIEYTSAIEVSTTTTIKAIAYDANGTSSTIASATYTINVPGEVVIVEDDKTTFLFNTAANEWGFPVGGANKLVDENDYTANNYTITVAGSNGNGYYYNDQGYLLLGKSGAYLTLPVFDFPVGKIEVVGSTSASESVKQNIFVGEVAVSTETTGAKNVTNEYLIAPDYQVAGTIYTLKVTSAHNTQVTQIIVHKAAIPVTIGETGYATLYYNDKAFEIPEGVTAQIVTGVTDKSIEFEELEDIIPAGTGVVLNGPQGTYDFKVVYVDSEAPVNNKLKGYDALHLTEGGDKYYKLAVKDDKVGFYWGEENGEAFESGAHKAYLALRADEAKEMGYFFDGLVTEIRSIGTETVSGEIYTIGGVRVKADKLQKGIYIVNGKKMVVK